MRNTISRATILLLVIFTLVTPSFGARYEKQLADGVVFIQDVRTDKAAPLVINVLRIDPKKPGVRVASALGRGTVMESGPTKGREVPSAMVARSGALAGVNADFFPFTGDPLGLQIQGGELVSEPMDRAAFGITAEGMSIFDKVGFSGTLMSSSGETFPLRGINRPRGKNEIVLFTPIYGSTTGAKDGIELPVSLEKPLKVNADVTATVTGGPSAAGGAIQAGSALISAQGRAADWIMGNLKQGDKVTLRFDVKSNFGKNWENVMEAVGGGPMLLSDGRIYVDTADERFKQSFSAVRNPRTAVGVTTSGEVLLVTVDGRQAISRGMTLNELAALMKSLGAVDAINLDGGGSTAFSIKGIVNNSPSEGKERAVANGLLVYSESKQSSPAPAVKFADAAPLNIASGGSRMIGIIDESTGKPASEEMRNSIIWGVTGGIGFVNQAGWFIPVKTGKGAIVALIGEKRLELPVIVGSGQPIKLTAKIVPDPTGAPNLGQISVKLIDENGNGVPGRGVTLTITGGTPDSRYKTTDAKGSVVFSITWDSTPDKAKIKVSSGKLQTSI
ncbi:MAG: phosphodiester glycosidase family protein [Armatimonadota bacterium]